LGREGGQHCYPFIILPKVAVNISEHAHV
jgi:hypothetical protein